jgi:hypothetical protein
VECGEVKISIPHNDKGRTCYGIEKSEASAIMGEEIPEFKVSPIPPIAPINPPISSN